MLSPKALKMNACFQTDGELRVYIVFEHYLVRAKQKNTCIYSSCHFIDPSFWSSKLPAGKNYLPGRVDIW